MKKLIIVTDAWFPQVNGVVTVFDKITSLLEKRGLRVKIVHPELFKMSFPFPLYKEVPLVINAAPHMKEIFDEEKPDFVHIATEWSLGLSARGLCLKNNIPFTTSYHTNFPLYAAHYFKLGKYFSKIAALYMYWFHSKADRMLVSTPTLKKDLEKEGYKNLAVWPFGIDTNFFVRNENKIPEKVQELKKPIFGYLGRVAKEKDVEEFLKLKLPGTKLIIGDGPLRKSLENTYRDAVFVGYQRGEGLISYLSCVDVLVFPSRTETFGLVVLEALSCGIPVAAHNCLGPKDIITSGVDGFLDEDLEKAAKACLNLKRERCREKALQFSWDKSADTFVSYL